MNENVGAAVAKRRLGEIDALRAPGRYCPGGRRRTVIVDLDPHRSAADWWETRTTDTPEMAESLPGDLHAVLDGCAGRRRDPLRDRYATKHGR